MQGSGAACASKGVVQRLGQGGNVPVRQEERNNTLADQALHSFALHVESCQGRLRSVGLILPKRNDISQCRNYGMHYISA